jgi:hypothetical protein
MQGRKSEFLKFQNWDKPGFKTLHRKNSFVKKAKETAGQATLRRDKTGWLEKTFRAGQEP